MRMVTPGMAGLLALLAAAPGAGAAQTEACPAAPPAAAPHVAPLPHAAAALRHGPALDILALGSGSLTSADLPSAEDGFAYRMAAALRAAFPEVPVRLTVQGGPGLTAVAMLAQLRAALAAHPFQLLLWQTGTVEAVHNLPAEPFRLTLADGIRAADDAGADVLLVDSQYSRALRTRANIQPFEQAIAAASALPGAQLFDRFALTRAWADSGGIDLDAASARARRQQTMLALNLCLGERLAAQVISGIAMVP